ncbi:MAG TPA: 30S ribosomal protein S4 [Clostridiales bacterium]|nr:30S ribosomal protein S4 [Clostridiales bacterium]
MAVNREPILKRCKALGLSPGVMGLSKQSKRNPGANKRQKISEYGLQLKEKQKLKFIYGVLEKQFFHYFEISEKMEGKAGENLITCLESRLDNVVYRMGLATTRRESRQLVTHGHFNVNGSRVDIPSYRIKVGDIVTLRDNSKSSPKFKEIAESVNSRVIPLWLEVSKEDLSAKISRMPIKEDLDYEIAEHLVVELYSK